MKKYLSGLMMIFLLGILPFNLYSQVKENDISKVWVADNEIGRVPIKIQFSMPIIPIPISIG